MLKSILLILLLIIPSVNSSVNLAESNKTITINQTSVSKGIFFVTPDSSYWALKYVFSIANSTIEIMSYEIWHPALESLIIDAANRGVTVKIAMEDKAWNLNFAYDLGQNNQSGRILIKMDNTDSVYHAKVICVDGKVLLVASDNFLPTAYPDNLPNLDQRPYTTPSRGFGAIIFDDTIAQQWENFFLNRFNNYLVWYNGSIGSAPWDNGDTTFNRHFYNLTTTNFKAELLLNPGSYEKIVDLINNAKRTIYIEAPYINLDDYKYVKQVIDALKNARARGVVVQIILEDDWPFYNASYVIDQLRSYGFYVAPAFSRIGDTIFLHNKAIIIDDYIVVLGSINFSDWALNENNETGLVIYSTEVAQFYKKVFEWDWNASTIPYFDEDNDGLSYYEETDIYHTNPSSPDYDYVMVQEPENYGYINKTEVRLSWKYWIEEKVTSVEIYLDGNKIADLPASTKEYVLSGLKDQELHHVKFVPSGIMLMRSTDLYFWVDTIPPSITVEGIVNNSKVDSAYLLVNVSLNDLAPDKVLVYRNGDLISSGLGTLNISLLRGKNKLEFVAIDKAGNKNRTVYIVESTKGGIGLNIVYPEEGIFVTNSELTLRWNSSFPPDYYLIYLNDSLVANVSGTTNSCKARIDKDGIYKLKIEAYINGELVEYQEITFFADVHGPEIIFITENHTLIFGNKEVSFKVKDFSKFTLEVYVNGKRVVYRIYTKLAEKTIEVRIEGFEDANITVVATDDFGHRSMSFIVLVNGYKTIILGLLTLMLVTIVALVVISKLISKNKKTNTKTIISLNFVLFLCLAPLIMPFRTPIVFFDTELVRKK